MKTQRKSGARNNGAQKSGAGNEGVTLVGLGNWGTALASALFAAGIPIREIVVRTLREPDHRLAKQWKTRLVTLEGVGRSAVKLGAKLDAPVLWICTPDAEIARTAAALARHGIKNSHPVVLHSSGALASLELAALRDAGASLASAHPLMSFPNRTSFPNRVAASLAGVPFAIEGEARAVRVARRLVRQLGGEPFSLRAEDKAMYHAYATFTSPLVTALLTAAQAAGVAAGLSKAEAARRMRPIVERTVENFFREGVAQSLSGPVARGDAATVARHLAVLKPNPSLQEIYRALQAFAVTALPGKRKPELRKILKRS